MRELMRGTRFLGVLLAASFFGGMVSAKGSDSESRLPAPTGPYAVGRTQFDWQDASRPDPKNPSGHREIVVWVWYPAAPKPEAAPAEWLPGKWRQFFSLELAKQGATTAEAIEAIRTHAYTDAPLASAGEKFPVLLFAPGMNMLPLEYSNLVEDMVSHGYIVAGIVPTDYSFSVFADGRVVEGARLKPQMIPPGQTSEQFRAMVAEERAKGATTAAVWSGDMIFTLNQLEKLNSDARSPFKGRLDLQQVGAFGHSQGGATSLQVAKNDARVRAVVDIDGMLPQELADRSELPKPVLVLTSDTFPRPAASGGQPRPALMNNLMDYDPVLRTAKPGYHLRLAGSLHLFSSDLGVLHLEPKSSGAMPPPPGSSGLGLKPPTGILPPPGSGRVELQPPGLPPVLGSIDPARALSITKAYVEAFFDQSLKKKTSTLLKGGSSDYPEITFENPAQ